MEAGATVNGSLALDVEYSEDLGKVETRTALPCWGWFVGGTYRRFSSETRGGVMLGIRIGARTLRAGFTSDTVVASPSSFFRHEYEHDGTLAFPEVVLSLPFLLSWQVGDRLWLQFGPELQVLFGAYGSALVRTTTTRTSYNVDYSIRSVTVNTVEKKMSMRREHGIHMAVQIGLGADYRIRSRLSLRGMVGLTLNPQAFVPYTGLPACGAFGVTWEMTASGTSRGRGPGPDPVR
jgi:hypothetical protein